MTDNFELIRPLLNFGNENTFYFIQILKRRKENPDMSTGVRVIDNFYLYSIDDLSKLQGKIIETCMLHNARAYLSINKLDAEKVALHACQKTLDLIIKGDFKAVKNVYPSACGSTSAESTKRWVVDFDTIDGNDYDEVKHYITELYAGAKSSNKIIAELPTKNGRHIIAEPFNLSLFHHRYPMIDVNKNSPTILYIP